ncbi:hypothetical protein GY15_10860 [Delftia sp. 670]|nr:hypothetical protein GY15_10860 [Delftia sp. 670]
MRAIRGDADPSPWKVTVTPAIKNADGSTTQGSIIRHNGVTGEVQQVDGAPIQPPSNHVNILKKDPKLAAQFDAFYGAGASKRYLG